MIVCHEDERSTGRESGNCDKYCEFEATLLFENKVCNATIEYSLHSLHQVDSTSFGRRKLPEFAKTPLLIVSQKLHFGATGWGQIDALSSRQSLPSWRLSLYFIELHIVLMSEILLR